MKKLILLIMVIISVLSLSTVSGVITVVSNETTEIGTETFTVNVVLNETTTSVLYVATDAGITNIVRTLTAAANSTSHIQQVTSLDGGTIYYWQMNGTSELTGTYSVNNNTETDSYALQGIVRVLMGLFVFIIVALVAVGTVGTHLTNSNTDTKTLAIMLATALIGALIVTNFVLAVLGL